MCFFYSKYSYVNLCSRILRESQDMLIWLFWYTIFFTSIHVFVINKYVIVYAMLEKQFPFFPIMNVPIFFIESYWIIPLLLPNVDNKLLKWNCYMCYVSRGSLHPIFIFRQDECWRKSAYRYALMHEGYDFIKLEGKF